MACQVEKPKRAPVSSFSDERQVLNAMLLACAGDGSDGAVAAMRALLEAGAVADTWAPNGSSVRALKCVAVPEGLLCRMCGTAREPSSGVVHAEKTWLCRR